MPLMYETIQAQLESFDIALVRYEGRLIVIINSALTAEESERLKNQLIAEIESNTVTLPV